MKPRRSQISGRALIALLLTSIVLFTLLGATVWASQKSLPGGTLYGIKRLSENAQRPFVSSKTQRAELELRFAAHRLEELEHCTSGMCRLEAAVALDAALTQAALAVALVPSSEREPLETQLMDLAGEGSAWLEQKIDQLFKTALSQRLRVPGPASEATFDPENPGAGLQEIIVELSALTETESVPDTEKTPNLFSAKTSLEHPFPREGAHADAGCEDCHADGVYQDTPRECASCHEDPHQGENGLQCQVCHTVESFSQAQVDHTGLIECTSCHTDAAPPNHYVGQCSQCHIAGESWRDVGFNHDGLADCQSCHTRPDGHFSGQCSQCHIAGGSWRDASLSHDGLTDCQSCHTRPDGHFSGQCSQCHVAGSSWSDVSFRHDGLTDCQSCHTRPDGHFSGQCSQCHVAGGSWRDASFDHSGLTDCQSCHTRPDDHFSGQCSQCHVAGESWRNASFSHNGLTDCQSCHTRPDGHNSGQCSQCHTTASWSGAQIGNHSFPINHGGAGGSCSTCHTGNNYATYTCISCHNQSEIIKEHEQDGSGDFASCARCHGGGEERDDDRDDDGERDSDDDDNNDRDGDDDDRGGDDDDRGGDDDRSDDDRSDDGEERDNDKDDDKKDDDGDEDDDD